MSDTRRRLVNKHRQELDEWLAGQDAGPAEHVPGTCCAEWCEEPATYLVHADGLNEKGVIVYLLWQDFEDVTGPNPQGRELYCLAHARHALSGMALLSPNVPDALTPGTEPRHPSTLTDDDLPTMSEAELATYYDANAHRLNEIFDEDNPVQFQVVPRELWNTTQVAAFLGVKPGTVSAYRGRGQMPAPVQTSGKRTHLWDAAEIRAWHATRRQAWQATHQADRAARLAERQAP